MKKIKYLLLLFLAAGCSCEKQMHRLTYRCPELFTQKTIIDTTFIPEYKYDTTFIFSAGIVDTFTVVKDRVEIKILRERDTLKTYIYVPADTIIKTHYVEVPKPVIGKKPSLLDRLTDILLIILLVAVAICASYIFYNFIRSIQK